MARLSLWFGVPVAAMSHDRVETRHSSSSIGPSISRHRYAGFVKNARVGRQKHTPTPPLSSLMLQ